MDVFTALGLVALGAILGTVGQGMRVIVGIKKKWEEAAKSGFMPFGTRQNFCIAKTSFMLETLGERAYRKEGKKYGCVV